MRWPFIFSGSPDRPSTAHRLRRRRRRRPAWWAPFTLVTLLFSGTALRATSVVPPDFPTLVAESELIAEGTVVDVSSRWIDRPQGRVIKTFVTFAIDKQLKGEPKTSVTLEFLGGQVGSESMRVSGMPEFRVGESEILFVSGNGVQFCPLVRFAHGRYHVRTDAGTRRRYVTRDDDSPLENVADVQLPAEHGHKQALRADPVGLSPDDFETQVAAEIARQAR